MTDNEETQWNWIVERWGRPPLEFEGELLSEASSWTDDAQRWQEVRIYRTATDKYVTEVVGRSTVEGEHDILWVNIYQDPAHVREGLYRTVGGRTFITDTAMLALQDAHEVDGRIVVLSTERI